MNLYFRLFWISLFSRFKSAVPVLGPCRTSFRVWPTDLDVLRHMNNGMYFSILDLARVDMMTRSGLLAKFTAQGWYPVVVAETMRFRKSLKPFARFEVESRVIGWDEKATLMKQIFYLGDTIMAEAVIRARFLKKAGGSVSTAELLALAGVQGSAPSLEPWIAEWDNQQR